MDGKLKLFIWEERWFHQRINNYSRHHKEIRENSSII
jgi:hypothetical protein